MPSPGSAKAFGLQDPTGARSARREPGSPKPDATGKTRRVGANPHIPRRVDEPRRIAAADMEDVVVDQRVHAPAPFFNALAMQRGVADVLVVGLPLPDRMLGQFQMRHEIAVPEQRGANPGAERENHLEAIAFDEAEALYIGIVQHARWPTERACEPLSRSKFS